MAGNGISTFALEDINDDQKSDIIVSSGTSNAIFLLINNGSGQFSEATNIVSINGSSAVICNDFDGDGLKDLILSSFQDQNLKIYTNNSASPGSFTAQNSFGQLYPWSSASEDFNNDGKPDLAIMDLRFGAMMVYMNISNWALPVDLKDFTGKIKNGAVRLEWNSGVEANFSHYEIEKREDDSAYVKIGSIEALGSGSNYHFNINQSVKYTNYRLKLVNNDGSSSYSKVVSIFNPMNSDAIKLWPNPGKNFIHVQLKQSGTFKIYDNSGKLIQSVKIEKGENQIDIRRLSAGTYYGITGTTKLKFIKR